MRTTTARSVFIITFFAFALSGAATLYADWTAARTPPPTCREGDPGCDAPIHAGNAAQAKKGALSIGSLTTSSIPPLGLDVNRKSLFNLPTLGLSYTDNADAANNKWFYLLGPGAGVKSRAEIIRSENTILTVGRQSLQKDGRFVRDGSITREMIITDDGKVAIGTNPQDFLSKITARLTLFGKIKISDGSEALGKVLTSDAAGLATWQNPPTLTETDTLQKVTTRPNGNTTTANIGIGDTSPIALLTVGEGDRFKVDAAGHLRLNRSADLFYGLSDPPLTSPLTPSVARILSFANGGVFDINKGVLYGIVGEPSNSGSGDIRGVNVVPITSYNGTVRSVYGLQGGVRTAHRVTTLTEGVALYASSPHTASGGRVTNAYGLYVGPQDTGESVTNGYGVYQTGTADTNYFAGRVGIGTAAPQATLHIANPTSQFQIGDRTDGKNGFFFGGASSGLLLGRWNVNPWPGTAMGANSLGVGGGAYVMGNLGIGTAQPTAKLDVDGQVRIRQGGTLKAGNVLTAVNSDGLAEWAEPKAGGVLEERDTLRSVTDTSGRGAGANVTTNAITVGDLRATGKATVEDNARIGGKQVITVERTVPDEGNKAAVIGSFFGSRSHSIRMSVVISNDRISVARSYLFTSRYNETGSTWGIVNPISSTGKISTHEDFALEAQQANDILSLRLRRLPTTDRRMVAITSTAKITIDYEGDPGATFAESSATGVFSPPASNYPTAVITQSGGNLGVGTDKPTARLDVDGQVRIRQGGTLKAGNVLTSDRDGLATWTDPNDIPGIIVTEKDTLESVTDTGAVPTGRGANANKTSRPIIVNTGGDEESVGFVVSKGRVGIGVNSPTVALEVKGQVKITGGEPGEDRVLTSDKDGLARWRLLKDIGGEDTLTAENDTLQSVTERSIGEQAGNTTNQPIAIDTTTGIAKGDIDPPAGGIGLDVRGAAIKAGGGFILHSVAGNPTGSLQEGQMWLDTSVTPQ